MLVAFIKNVLLHYFVSAMQDTRVQSLGWEDPLEKEMAAHSNILAWEIPGHRSWQAVVHGITKSRTRLSD